MNELTPWAFFMAGLLGGGHCLAMCGGIVSAFSLQLPQRQSRWPLLLAFNAGRLLSYALLGAAVGGLAGQLGRLDGLLPVQLTLHVLASVLLVLLGLYLAGVAGWVRAFEAAGGYVWRWLQPWLARCLPVHKPSTAFAAGLLWGWMPCGLVYTALTAALASAAWREGGVIMLAFGLGTLPNLLLIGGVAQETRRWLRQPLWRQIAGWLIVAMGLYRVLLPVLQKG